VPSEHLLTRKQAAAILGLEPQTLARWKWEGREDRPPEVVLGIRAIRYRESDLIRWIEDRTGGPSSPRQPRP
jgi:predicted DNA-binding transcriptional regulator AlpA